MPDQTLSAAPALGGYDAQFGDTRLVEVPNLPITSLAIPQGAQLAVAQSIQSELGLAWPEPGRATSTDEAMLALLSPDQAMLLGPQIKLAETGLAKVAYLTDQTDVWVALDLEGPGRFAAMERLCPVDLSASTFGQGAFARTVMEHMGAVVIWKDPNTFRLMSARSSAGSFLHAVETSLKYTQ